MIAVRVFGWTAVAVTGAASLAWAVLCGVVVVVTMTTVVDVLLPVASLASMKGRRR